MENIDITKSMVEQIEEYSVGAYRVADLNDHDKAIAYGMAYMIDEVDCYEPNYEEGVIGLIKIEVAEDTTADIVRRMISALNEFMYNCIDGYEDV